MSSMYVVGAIVAGRHTVSWDRGIGVKAGKKQQ